MATWTLYQDFTEQLLKGNHDLDAADGTYVLILTTADHTPLATHTNVTDLVLGSNEVSGTNYTGGGVDITSMTVVETGGTATWDAGNVQFDQSATGFSNAKNAHIAKATGGALVAYAVFSGDKGNVDGDLTLTIADILDAAIA